MSTAAGNHYITKRKSRSGSIPYGNLPLTLDISFQVKCYQSLTPIQDNSSFYRKILVSFREYMIEYMQYFVLQLYRETHRRA